MFGGSGSKGRVNEVYIFHLDDRVDIIELTLFMVQLTVSLFVNFSDRNGLVL